MKCLPMNDTLCHQAKLLPGNTDGQLRARLESIMLQNLPLNPLWHLAIMLTMLSRYALC